MPREELVLAVSLALLASAGLLLPPIFSPDRDLVVVPVAIALGLSAVLRVPDRRCEPLLVAFLAATLVLILLGRWHAGQSAGEIIGGRIPFNDQAGYVLDALRLGEGHRLSPFSSRRPLHVLFLAAVLKVAQGNFAVASVLMCVLAALALAALALAVRRTHGTTAAVVLTLLCVLFYRRFVGTGLSENAGFILGCLAAALLWRGAGT
ncbi:MAG: hypothetical protein IRY94_20635, partial [Rhodospirillaceae bacterium]|nr:hypothetical protein [Rhodospirillaceae bacterium]